jgi:chloramphenicol 3-O-phosphotransferase
MELSSTMTAQLILLGGPAGSGKTTTADAWATAQAVPTAHLNLDSVRGRFRSHLRQPHIAGWTPEVDWQYNLARRVVVAAVREYIDSGVTCIVDDGLLPTHPAISYERWSEQLQGLPRRVVILLPTVEICLARNAQRPAGKRLADGLVRRFHGMSSKWIAADVPVIDNSDLTVSDTVIAITDALSYGRGG